MSFAALESQSLDECRVWRQGDVFHMTSLSVMGGQGGSTVATPLGVALVSQSCDASQPSRHWVQVAPVVVLDGSCLREAVLGKRVDYAPLPALGPNHFADMTKITSVHKGLLIPTKREAGVLDHQTGLKFQGAVARRFGRFAFPDEVVRALQPLKDVVGKSTRRAESALGKIAEGLYTIRIDSTSGWEHGPYDIQLDLVFEAGFLPFGDPTEDLPEEPAALRARVVGPDTKTMGGKVARAIAEAFISSSTEAERYWLLMYLGEAWAAECQEAASLAGVSDTVRSVGFDVVSVDDYALSRVNRTVDLDLDHLSEPVPRDP